MLPGLAGTGGHGRGPLCLLSKHRCIASVASQERSCRPHWPVRFPAGYPRSCRSFLLHVSERHSRQYTPQVCQVARGKVSQGTDSDSAGAGPELRSTKSSKDAADRSQSSASNGSKPASRRSGRQHAAAKRRGRPKAQAKIAAAVAQALPAATAQGSAAAAAQQNPAKPVVLLGKWKAVPDTSSSDSIAESFETNVLSFQEHDVSSRRPSFTEAPERDEEYPMPASAESLRQSGQPRFPPKYNQTQREGGVAKAGGSWGRFKGRAHQLHQVPEQQQTPQWRRFGGEGFESGRSNSAKLSARVHMTRRDETEGVQEGYYVQKFQAAGLLDEKGMPVPEALEVLLPARGEALNISINKLMTHSLDWRSITHIVRDLGYLFDHINTATAIHRIAKLSRCERVRLEDIRAVPGGGYETTLRLVRERLSSFQPRQLGNVSWAMAVLKEDAADIMQGIVARSLAVDPVKFKEQELSNLAWAIGEYRICEPRLMDMVTGEMMRRNFCQLFTGQALSNTVWACTVTNYRNPDFLEAIGTAMVARLSEFAPQAISNTLWGFATLDYYHPTLFQCVATYLVPRLHELNSQELSNVIISYAKVNRMEQELLQAFEAEICMAGRLAACMPQAVANIIWAFATLRYYPSKLLPAAAHELESRLPEFKDQELSNMLWAMARLGYHPGRSLIQICEHIRAKVNVFSGQAISNCLWALAVLQGTNLPAFGPLMDQLVTGRLGDMEEAKIHQLFQALFLAELEAKAGNGTVALVSSKVRDAVFQHWRQKAVDTKASNFHLDVDATLTAMGIQHEYEYLAEDGLFSIDIALLQGGLKVAIEVDGPFHFTYNTHQPLGHTILRRRLLRALGWTLVSVPFYDWYRMNFQPERKFAYLSSLLTESGIPLSNITSDTPGQRAPGLAAMALQREEEAIQALNEELELAANDWVTASPWGKQQAARPSTSDGTSSSSGSVEEEAGADGLAPRPSGQGRQQARAVGKLRLAQAAARAAAAARNSVQATSDDRGEGQRTSSGAWLSRTGMRSGTAPIRNPMSRYGPPQWQFQGDDPYRRTRYQQPERNNATGRKRDATYVNSSELPDKMQPASSFSYHPQQQQQPRLGGSWRGTQPRLSAGQPPKQDQQTGNQQSQYQHPQRLSPSNPGPPDSDLGNPASSSGFLTRAQQGGEEAGQSVLSLTASPGEERMSELSGMTLARGLRELCSKYGLPHSGRKNDVIARIMRHEGLLN